MQLHKSGDDCTVHTAPPKMLRHISILDNFCDFQVGQVIFSDILMRKILCSMLLSIFFIQQVVIK